jgi:hypothetical protein
MFKVTPLLPAVFSLLAILPVSAITIDDFTTTSLSGSGKTLELSIEGDGNGPNPGPTWTLTFDKSPANQATVKGFPGNTAASTTTWAYTGPPFPDAHEYAFTATSAFGNKPASIQFWISEPGARFIVYYDGKSYYGGVTFKDNSGPDIAVQQPAGTDLTDGSAKKPFGTAKIGGNGKSKTFTIKNTGNTKLTGISIKKSGPNKGDFDVSDPEKTSLAKGASTTFKVTFRPSAKDTRNAAIAIASNDPDEDPFNIKLSGEGVK